MNGVAWFFLGMVVGIFLGGFLSYEYAGKVIAAAQKVATDLHLAAEKIKSIL